MPKPKLVGGVFYPSKAAALDAARAVRDRYITTPRAPITDPTDTAFEARTGITRSITIQSWAKCRGWADERLQRHTVEERRRTMNDVQIGDKSAQCAECGAVEVYKHPIREWSWRLVLAVEFRWLCYGCWHQAREKQQPWVWVWKTGKYAGCPFGMHPSTYLYHEGIEAAERNRWDVEGIELVKASSWFGDRLTHPGYSAIRREEVLSKLTPDERRAYE